MDNINFDSEPINFDELNAISVLISAIMYGIIEAIQRCERNKEQPFCVQKGGNTLPQQKQTQDDDDDEDQSNTVIPEQVLEDISNSDAMKSFNNLTSNVNDKLTNIVNNVSNDMLDSFEENVIGDLGEKQVRQTVLDRMQDSTAIINKLTRDPAIQDALKDLSRELAVLSFQMLDMTKPIIERLIDKQVQMFALIGRKSMEGISELLWGLGTAALAEIPILGGGIDVTIAAIRGYNSALIALAPAVQFSSEAFFTAIGTAMQTVQFLRNEQDKIEVTSDKLHSAIRSSTSGVSNTLQSGMQNTVGRASDAMNTGMQNTVGRASDAMNTGMQNTVGKATDAMNTGMQNTVGRASDAMNDNIRLQKGGAIRRKKIKQLTKRLNNAINQFHKRCRVVKTRKLR